MAPTHEVAAHDVSSKASRTTGQPIGQRLQAARAERGLTLEDASAKVLLSPSQIRGLEHGDAKAFYSPHFYNQGLRKYAALLDMADALPNGAEPVTPESASRPQENDLAALAPRRGPAPTTIVAALVVVAGAIAGGLWWQARPVPELQATAPEAPPPVPPAPPVDQPPAVAPIESSGDVQAASASALDAPVETTGAAATGTYGTVRVNTATWIYVRHADGTVVEQTLDAGAVHTIAARPTYLAIGSADVVLTVGGQRIDVAAWVSNGQLRISGRAFAAPPLLQDTPTP